MTQPPEGWYPDPRNPAEEVYWLGDRWSNARRPAHTLAAGPQPSAAEAAQPARAAMAASGAAPARAAGPDVGTVVVHQPEGAPGPRGSLPKSALGRWAMILGIIALVTAVIPGFSLATWLFALPAIGLGIAGLMAKDRRKGTALAGVIEGGAAMLLAIVVSIGFLASLGAASTTGGADPAPAVSEEPAAEPTAVAPSQEPEPEVTEEVAAAPPPSEYGTYPAAQQQFVGIVQQAATDYRNAETDLQKSAVLQDRDAKACAVLASGVTGWVGKIHTIGATNDGLAYLELEIAPTIVVGTWNNAFSDFQDDTLIPASAPFYGTLVPLAEGTKVTFSGAFVPGDGSCLDTKNLTETFNAADPNFLFKFNDVAPQG